MNYKNRNALRVLQLWGSACLVLFCGEAVPLGKVISGRISALLLESRFAELNYTLAAPVVWDPRFDHNLIGQHQICRIGISAHPLERTKCLCLNRKW